MNPIAISFDDIHAGRYFPREFTPPLWQIPAEFQQTSNPWAVVASHLMWQGTSALKSVAPRAGIDAAAALLHVGAVLHATRTSVEHREAASAYLLSQWFIRIELEAGPIATEYESQPFVAMHAIQQVAA